MPSIVFLTILLAIFLLYICFNISGTTKIKNLDDNIGSLTVKLTKEEDLKEISDAVPIEEVAGDRTYGNMKKATWTFANTPQKDGNV